MPSIDVRKNSKIFIGVGAVVLFALGIVIGRFLLGGGGATGSLNGRTTLSEGELNTPIASYTYNGQTKEVTAREVIENTSGLDAAKQSDGTYAVPAADKIIGYVRNALVVAEAQSKAYDARFVLKDAVTINGICNATPWLKSNKWTTRSSTPNAQIIKAFKIHLNTMGLRRSFCASRKCDASIRDVFKCDGLLAINKLPR